MKDSNKKSLLTELGQTSLEYILMIVVMAIVATSIFTKLEGYLISNPDSFKNRYLGSYKNMFNGGSLKAEYKYFTLRR